MKSLSVFVLACVSVLRAQTPPADPPPALPDLPDETVVAILDDGAKFTMGEFRKIYAVLPPQQQQMVLRNREVFLKQWAFMRKLAKMAEEKKLDQQSPTKEQLEYARLQVLSSAELSAAMTDIEVQPAQIIEYYDTHKDDYKQVKVKAIYIAFGASSSDNRTEDAAKAKAEKLVGEIRGGADFVKLVKEDSDDDTSRAKDGDFVTLRHNDNVPEAVRNAVFALKQGEVSDPVRQPNGYYILRADEVIYRPLSQVRDEIFTALKQQQYKAWLEQTNTDTKVQITSPSFIGAQPMAVKPK